MGRPLLIARIGALALALLLVACQSEATCRLGIFPHGPTAEADCVACIQRSCEEAYVSCYGADWASGEVTGGSCQALASCLDQGTCQVGRIPSCTQSTPCTLCGGETARCVDQECASVCGQFPGPAMAP
jgi:hypothetical protein